MPEGPLTFTFGKITQVPGNSFCGAVEVSLWGEIPLPIGSVRGWEVEIVTIDDPIEAEVLKYKFIKASEKQRITFEYIQPGDEVLVAIDSKGSVLFALNLFHYVGWSIGQRISKLITTPLYFAREDSFGVPNVIWRGACLKDGECPLPGRFHTDVPDGVGWDKTITIWKCTRDFYNPWVQIA